jgi:uncharacterized membrane protein
MACFTALNVVARVALAGGPPNVKPVAFLAITAGVITGAFGGLVVGGLSMFISDLYFGGGYWTIIDATSMGAIAWLAGLLWARRDKITRIELVIGSFVLTAIYDIAASIIPAWIFGYNWWIAILLLYIPFLAGGVIYPFGLVHEFTTAVLMGAIGPALIGRVRTLVSHNT